MTTGFTWDKAGNQTSRTAGANLQTQNWDAEGELTSVTGGGTNQSNVYDAGGTRLVQQDAAGVTVYLPGGQEVRATSSAVSATRWYSFAGHVVAVRTGAGMGAVSSIVTDAHGTPVASVHNTNWTAAVSRIRTDPFGAARTGQTGAVAGHGFLGAASDSTGFTLLGARYYDPVTGTFISADPELSPGVPAQFNAYVYSGNNPVTWADPSGRNWWNDAVKNVSNWYNDNKAVIAGAVVGTLAFAACTSATIGGGVAFCAVVGGMAGAAVTNVMQQAASKKKFNVVSFGNDVALGGLLGWALGPVAGAVGKFVAPVANQAIKAVSAGLRSLGSGGKAAASSAAAQARASIATVRTGAGGTRSTQQAASCAIGNSFVPGTLVAMAVGAPKAIEKIEVGDTVLATDPDTGESTPQPVVATITGSGMKDLVSITTTSEESGDSATVVATAGHPFWVPTEQEWIDADDLKPGMWLQAGSGTWVQITAIEQDRREQAVHNLTIDTVHTYYVYVGDTPVLAHNCGGAGPVAKGQQGEADVRAAFGIGDKVGVSINGRDRIFDGLNGSAVSEVKNVARLSFTRQLRDYSDYALGRGIALDIYTRVGTRVSGPLRAADLDPKSPVNLIEFLP